MERRLAFGGVAELYDRARPAYPGALVDDVLAAAGARPALEIGAGTGKATVLFAARGLPVLALEPSAAMAALARRNCAPYPNVRIEVTEFERWDPGGNRFGLVLSAQAFHWIEPDVRYAKSRAVLDDGGVLAIFWSRPRWERCALRQALDEAYHRAAPALAPTGPMHPASDPGLMRPGAGEDPDGFSAPEHRTYEWCCEYSAEQYAELLQTHSDHIVLPPAQREALLAAVGEAISASGHPLHLPYVTELWMLRAR